MTWCLCTESRGHGGQVRSWRGRARILPSGLGGSPALPTSRSQTLASDAVREHISLTGVIPTVTSFTAAALGNSPAVQWLRLQASTAGDMGSVSDQETMILRAELCSQKKKKNTLQWLCPEGLLLFSSHRWRDEGWENQGVCPGSQDKDRAWLQCPVGALEAQALPSRRGSLAGVWRGDRFPFFSSLSPPGWREGYIANTLGDAVCERIGSIGMLGSIRSLTGRFRIFQKCHTLGVKPRAQPALEKPDCHRRESNHQCSSCQKSCASEAFSATVIGVPWLCSWNIREERSRQEPW